MSKEDPIKADVEPTISKNSRDSTASSSKPPNNQSIREWYFRKYPAYTLAVGLLVAVIVLGGCYLYWVPYADVKQLQDAVINQRILYEAKLEEKKQRLAIVLSHLEDNPELTAPDNKHSLIGRLAKMEWKYSPKSTDVNQSAHKPLIIEVRKADIAPKDEKGKVTGNGTIRWEDLKRDNSADQALSRHSIIELRNAKTPRCVEARLRVTGNAAWYAIKERQEVNECRANKDVEWKETANKGPNTAERYLWRVIPADREPSGQVRAESSWGPFSTFTIFKNVLDRIIENEQIIIGSYSIAQLPAEKVVSKIKDFCEELSDNESVTRKRQSAGLSETDYKTLCRVLREISKGEKVPDRNYQDLR